ncbi:MAG: NRDE family protein, partial [Deltaproteobacteria bacterium]|nr:NRDE family protein [Deltaproteobacteria bacterium]
GLLVSDYLTGTKTPKIYLEHIKTIGHRYNGFNLLLGDSNGLYYYSNKMDKIKELKPGLYGLSNHLLDTPWPKVKKGKTALKKLLAGKKRINTEDIFDLLTDMTLPPDDRLPDTGIGLKWERILSPMFITSDIYGTRSSSIVLIDRSHETSFIERSFIPEESGSIKQKTRRFNFQISGHLL